MPSVEAPFITAIIREKEKTFFSEHEVARILNTPSVTEMREVLMGTPYAMHLADGTSIPQSAIHHLEHEYAWLSEHLDNARVLAFISARYDALNIALGILSKSQGDTTMPSIPKLGRLGHAQLQEMIFDEIFPESTHTIWQDVIQKQLAEIKHESWTSNGLFSAMQTALETALDEFAITKFMHDIARITKEHHESDANIRVEKKLPENITAYELSWDTQVITLAKAFRHEPVGYDPIVAYWILKELEVKNVRMLYSALQGRFSNEETTALIRNLA